MVERPREQLGAGNMKAFSSAELLSEAIEQSDVGPLRKALLRRVMVRRPELREEMLSLAMEQLRSDCEMRGIAMPMEGQLIDAIDWQNLLDLIIRYLPTIIQLILLIL